MANPSEIYWVHLVQPSKSDLANLPANRLGIGERSVLAYAQAQNLPIVGLDDRQARMLAQQIEDEGTLEEPLTRCEEMQQLWQIEN